MKRSTLTQGHNILINPFTSHVAIVFHSFAYIISATIIHVQLIIWIATLHVER